MQLTKEVFDMEHEDDPEALPRVEYIEIVGKALIHRPGKQLAAVAELGDYIIRDSDGNMYACEEELFKLLFKPEEEI